MFLFSRCATIQVVSQAQSGPTMDLLDLSHLHFSLACVSFPAFWGLHRTNWGTERCAHRVTQEVSKPTAPPGAGCSLCEQGRLGPPQRMSHRQVQLWEQAGLLCTSMWLSRRSRTTRASKARREKPAPSGSSLQGEMGTLGILPTCTEHSAPLQTTYHAPGMVLGVEDWVGKCKTVTGSVPMELTFQYGSWGLNQLSSDQIRSGQSLSRVRLFATPWIAAHQASLSITNSRSSLRLTSIESVMPSSHLILCRPLLLLPPIPPSITVFSNESTLHMRWSKYWSFSFSIIPSKEIPGLKSFRMDWLDLLAVQGTLKSPTPQFKRINSLALSFLHSPTLTSIHDHRKNHSLD